MKSVLLHVYDDDALDDRLQVALDICRTFDAHLTCLQVTPYNAYVSFEPLGGVYTQAAVLESIREREDDVRKRIAARLAQDDVRWDWIATDGPVVQTLVSASALNDLVVIGQYPGAGDAESQPLPIVDEVAVHAACAVLMVPAGVGSFDAGRPAVIGWNASPEAANALRNALPLLRAASSVHIVSIGENGEDFPQTSANTYLSRHGVASDLHALAMDAKSASGVLEDFASKRGAGCLVIGAYGRSRFRETLLGGVTRDLLRTSRIPLLLGH
ncbi:MAG: universal stress protein [Sphingomonadaceae bacterium]|nr:universal stress protein [Sphingomonadaceae bacterium]